MLQCIQGHHLLQANCFMLGGVKVFIGADVYLITDASTLKPSTDVVMLPVH